REAEEEDERQAAAEKEARRKAKEQEEISLPEIEVPKAKPKAREPEPAPKAAGGGGGFSDSLLADLESFSTNDEREQKEREERERKEKEAAAQRAREAEERRQKEDAERAEREEKERRKREEKERKAQEEAELREREEKEKQRLKDEEEKRKKEAEEREKKAKQEESLAAKSTRQAAFDAEQRAKRERELMARPVRAAGAHRIERKGGLGKTIGIGLFLIILIGLGVAHVIPLDVGPYQTAASEALRRPVKIGSANLSLFTGLQLKFSDVSVGDTRIGQVRAHPSIGALTGPKKDFSLLEIDGLKIDQQGVGEALFTKMKGDNFSVARIVARKLELTGPLTLPKDLEGDLSFDAEGSLRQGFLRGPETLLAKFAPKGQSVEFDMSAQSFSVPFAPDIAFGQFSMKGTATPQGLSIAEWDGQILNGKLSGTANVRWNEGWVVDGVMTARGINAAVFAPALLSDGRAEGSGKFAMRGEDPAKLADTSRIDGSFTVNRGVLGSIDLSRAIQTQGRFGTGRTQFNEMNGQAVYDRGAVSLRNVTISAGQLNAGASAEIAQNGALSGRIVAEVKIAQQHLRATLNLGGTVKDPQVKN
ncbi:MAG TPA: hypothetical protein VJQ58_15205, partial [Burkholderiales bacterium]|nr:hypothetical protein [Burkholderiales bacterium]